MYKAFNFFIHTNITLFLDALYVILPHYIPQSAMLCQQGIKH